MNDNQQSVLFVTGRLAESALRQEIDSLVREFDIRAEIAVLGISVAALMHVDWVIRKLTVPEGIERVILPGWCQGDLALLEQKFGIPFQIGPKDLRQLRSFWGNRSDEPVAMTEYDIEIIGEINHAPRLSSEDLIRVASNYRHQGADLIDYGTVAGESSSIVGEHVRLLKQEGFRVSIDSFDRQEVEAAVNAGAELVLSCNSSNLEWVRHVDAELVVIPDDFSDLSSMQPAIDILTEQGKPFRLDPILEPIGFGFFRSILRYSETRTRWSDIPVMMGIGNVTELSEVDSAGVNFLLIAICQELNIRSVLTTSVINWARSSITEVDLARRLIKYAIDQKQLPKHLDSGLVSLRDPYLYPQTEESLKELSEKIRDANFRLFAEQDGLHLMNREGHWTQDDPFSLLPVIEQSARMDVPHAFYLGYELAKAEIARQLGKQYVQDQPLNWGHIQADHHSEIDRHQIRKQKPS